MDFLKIVKNLEEMSIVSEQVASSILAIEQAILHGDYNAKEYDWSFHLIHYLSVNLNKDFKNLIEEIYETSRKEKKEKKNEN